MSKTNKTLIILAYRNEVKLEEIRKFHGKISVKYTKIIPNFNLLTQFIFKILSFYLRREIPLHWKNTVTMVIV
jgi:hypothetical protein